MKERLKVMEQSFFSAARPVVNARMLAWPRLCGESSMPANAELTQIIFKRTLACNKFMATPREKFQKLLKKLFQFDCAELDFGIYRIMNQKRAVIEQFIETDLVKGIAKELASGALAQEAGLAEQLAEVTAKIKEDIDDDAIDADGNLDPKHHGTKLGKQYLGLCERAGEAKATPEQEAEIFNHLYAFFSRYYDDGDFMSLRRYSKRDKYAIPYNGEEVHLHWANADQYYIKTGENFTDYSYKHGGWAVQFKLRNADVEQNNVKGAKRFFIPRAADVSHDEKNSTLTIPFEFRPLNASEEISYGKGNGAEENGNGNAKTKKKKGQEGILADAIAAIQIAAKKNTGALAALMHEKRKDADGETITLLEHHLRTYVRGNSTDFFIHKDLKGFLERELDFYLKNEVLNLDELEAGGESRSAGWFQTLRAIKGIGRKIIAFVAQIENFQKRLFEKKKFVTEVNYCVTLDRVPEELYPEISKNKAQIEEWKRLFHIHEIEGDLAAAGFTEPLKVDFLKENDKLLVDTRFFGADFKDKLIASINDFDKQCDGLLIHSENYQALTLLKNAFREQIRCVYIDPPYNTNASAILYKNNYRHSSWATLMHDRLAGIKPMLKLDGAIFVSIDKAERTILEHAMDAVFGAENRIEELIWAMNTNNSQAPNYSTNHEYVEVYAKDRATAERDPEMFREPKPGYEEVMGLVVKLKPEYPPVSVIESELRKLYDQHRLDYQQEIEAQGLEWEDEKGNDSWKGLFSYSRAEYRDSNGKLIAETDAKKRKAEIWIWQEGDASMPATKQAESTNDPNSPNWRFYKPLHPVTGKPCPHPKSGWKFAYSDDKDSPDKRSFVSLDRDGRIAWGSDEAKVPRLKRMLHEVETNIGKSVFQDYSDGEKQTSAMFGKSGLFLAPKHADFVSRFILHASKRDGLVLDCFGGSGSTAHAVIKLNRDDRGSRKYILAEVGEYFDTLLKPRVCKAIYSAAWRNGKPTNRTTGISHCFKYLRLESYEDALDNITFEAADAQTMFQLEDYVLSYMLDLETKQSETLLNVAKLDAPFDYKLKRHGKDEPLPVDLPETFNYLIGLHVASRTVHNNKGTRYLVYRGKSDGRETVILWRTTRGWKQEQFEADRDFVAKQKLTEAAEDIFVNTDSFIKDARSLDPVFKKKMFSED
jgi:adenine-specific DNA-methyltransferase